MAKPLIKALASENSLAGRPRCRTTCNWENNFLKGNPPASRLSPQPPAPGRAMRSGKKAARPTFRPTPRLGEPTAIQPPRRTAPFPRPRGLVPRHSPVDGRDSGYGRVDGVGTACARGRVLNRPRCALRCSLSAAGTAAEPAPGRRLGFSPLLAAPR